MSVDRTRRQPASTPMWVEAGPFRAHLEHLMAAGDLSVDAVAHLAEVSLPDLRRLLQGREGRVVRRLSAETARRLLRVTTGEARMLGRRLLPAEPTVADLEALREAGHSAADLADRLRIGGGVLEDLLARRTTVCSPTVAARIGAARVRLAA